MYVFKKNILKQVFQFTLKTMTIKCQTNKIADTFNNYFTNTAQSVVNDIKYEDTTYFKIINAHEGAVKITMYNLFTEHSGGLDDISSNVLK